MGDWPAWATQPISVVDPDPRWADLADELVERLHRTLGESAPDAIHHVGSTAVPGLAAKPVIDLLAIVESWDETLRSHDALTEAGWELVPPELDERPWRRLYVLPDGARRVAHLHLVRADHPRARDTLTFRDRLRSDPSLADEYAELKRAAARAHRDDREAYTEAKSAFVARVISRG